MSSTAKSVVAPPPPHFASVVRGFGCVAWSLLTRSFAVIMFFVCHRTHVYMPRDFKSPVSVTFQTHGLAHCCRPYVISLATTLADKPRRDALFFDTHQSTLDLRHQQLSNQHFGRVLMRASLSNSFIRPHPTWFRQHLQPERLIVGRNDILYDVISSNLIEWFIAFCHAIFFCPRLHRAVHATKTFVLH